MARAVVAGRRHASVAEVVVETFDLVHPFMQDGHDADVAVCEKLPMYRLSFVAADIAVDAEFRRDGGPREVSAAMTRDCGRSSSPNPEIAKFFGPFAFRRATLLGYRPCPGQGIP